MTRFILKNRLILEESDEDLLEILTILKNVKDSKIRQVALGQMKILSSRAIYDNFADNRKNLMKQIDVVNRG